jgi:hypothetical protein
MRTRLVEGSSCEVVIFLSMKLEVTPLMYIKEFKLTPPMYIEGVSINLPENQEI